MTAARIVAPPAAGLRWLTRTVWGGVLVALAGSIGYVVVPLVVAALRNNTDTPELWIGLIGSADPTGMFIGAALALLRRLHRKPRQMILGTLATSMVCNAISFMIQDVTILLAVRLLAGMSGGIALALALAVLGRASQPDRNFALLTLTQVIFGMVAASVAEAGSEGLGVIYHTMFITQLLGLAGAMFIPRSSEPEPASVEAAASNAPLNLELAAYCTLGNIFSAAGFLILWSNIEALAGRQGLVSSQIVAVLDVGLAGGLAGTLLTLAFDGRRHRSLICSMLFAIGLISILSLVRPVYVALIFPAVFLFQVSTAAACYGFGAVSDADRSGRLPIVHILAVKAGFSIAPFLASTLIKSFGLDAVPPAAFLATFIAMLSYRKLITTAKGIVLSN